MTEFSEKLPANVEVIDPLGEIRARAKELWEADGSPAGRPWQSYFSEAEAQFCGASSRSSRPLDSKTTPAKSERHPHLRGLSDRDPESLLSTIAASLPSLLELHESDMLCELLLHYPFSTQQKKATEALAAGDVAALVAELAGEYEEAFHQTHGTNDPLSIPLDRRIEYWLARIEQRERSDEPLSNADRNTMARLEQLLAANGLSLERR